MSSPEQIAKAFVDYYYQIFDSNQRTNLVNLYQPESQLTFEGEKLQGRELIHKKLTSLQFSSVRHQISTLDCQIAPGGLLTVFVSGNLKVDNSENPLKFSQVFNLVSAGGGYFVMNDLFRLNYA